MFFGKFRKKKNSDIVPLNIGSGLIVANWKCYKKSEEAIAWLDQFAQHYSPREGLQVVIAPTMLCLEKVAGHLDMLDLQGVSLAAQDVSPFPQGSYTGAVSADMLKGLVDYVIVGHSERRRYFKENNRIVANKVEEVIDAGLVPIVCVDEENCLSQLAALGDLDSKRVIVAYGPVDALNFRISEEPERVGRMGQAIRNNKPEWPVIYGGAVSSENCREYLGLETIAGVFVASASLDVQSFIHICNSVGEV